MERHTPESTLGRTSDSAGGNPPPVGDLVILSNIMMSIECSNESECQYIYIERASGMSLRK